MLWIIHSNCEQIFADEWDIVLSTLDQLGLISMSSSKLGASYLKKTESIAGCLVRFPTFTTCFTQGALSQLMLSLVKLSEAVSFQPLIDHTSNSLRENSESTVGDDNEDGNSGKGQSLGGKLITWTGGLAGRAFGGGPAQSGAPLRRSSSAGTSQVSKTYSEEFRETSCLQMRSMNISTPAAIVKKVPLSLLLMVTVTEANLYRLSVIEEILAKHLCEIVARSTSIELQSFAMDLLTHLMPLSLSKSEISLKYGRGPLTVPAGEDVPFEIIPIKDANKPGLSGQRGAEEADSLPGEPQLLKILCHTIQRTTQAATANTVLLTLNTELERSGHCLSEENLIIVIKTLSVLSGCHSSDCEDFTKQSSKQWGNVAVSAFSNLKLILDNHLELMSTSLDPPLKSTAVRDAILDSCVAFGISRHDLNTSLTATGMLWSLADRDPSPDTVDLVTSKLALLATDGRPEL